MGCDFFTKRMETEHYSAILEQCRIHISLCGHQQDSPFSRCGTRIISDYELIYNVGGTSIVTIQDKVHRLHAGEMVLIPKFTSHSIDTPSDDLHNNYWIHFQLAPCLLSDQFIAAVYQAWGGFTYAPGMDQALLTSYDAIMREAEQGEIGFTAMMNAHFQQIIIRLIRKCGLQSIMKPAPALVKPIYTQLLSYVYERFLSIESIRQIAEDNHISVSYCEKLFQRYLGKTPAGLIMELKLREAEKLLKSTDLPIHQIAENLGFSSPYHFTNTFKKYYQISPLNYRKLNFNC